MRCWWGEVDVKHYNANWVSLPCCQINEWNSETWSKFLVSSLTVEFDHILTNRIHGSDSHRLIDCPLRAEAAPRSLWSRFISRSSSLSYFQSAVAMASGGQRANSITSQRGWTTIGSQWFSNRFQRHNSVPLIMHTYRHIAWGRLTLPVGNGGMEGKKSLHTISTNDVDRH